MRSEIGERQQLITDKKIDIIPRKFKIKVKVGSPFSIQELGSVLRVIKPEQGTGGRK